MTEITISRLMHYLRAYDEHFEEYPEHPYEGASVGKWILECALGDGLIAQEEFVASLEVVGGEDMYE